MQDSQTHEIVDDITNTSARASPDGEQRPGCKTIYAMLHEINQNCIAVNLLPNIILREIFLIYAAEYSDVEHRNVLYIFPWAVLSEVCLHWRRVAIATPGLWTRIVIPSPPLGVAASLLRSLDHPLDVIFYSPPRREGLVYPTATLTLLFREMGRIRTLIVDQVTPQMCTALKRSSPAKQLETFTGLQAGSCALLRQLPGSFSALKTLEFAVATRDVWAIISSGKLKAQIEKLIVYDVERGTTLDEILKSLAKFEQCLTCLYLCFDDLPSDSSAVANVVPLRKLEILQVHGPLKVTANLLAKIELPAFTKIYSTRRLSRAERLFGPLMEESRLPHKLCRAFPDHLSPHDNPILLLDITPLGPGKILVAGWTLDPSTSGSPYPQMMCDPVTAAATPGFKFSVELPAWSTTIDDLVSQIPLERVRTLRLLNLGFGFSESFRASLVRFVRTALPDLRTLEVSDIWFAWIFDMLFHDESDASSPGGGDNSGAIGGSYRVPLPRLETLRLVNFPGLRGCPNLTLDHGCYGCAHILALVLRGRCHRGCPLRKLELFASATDSGELATVGMSEEEVRELMRWVVPVEQERAMMSAWMEELGAVDVEG